VASAPSRIHLIYASAATRLLNRDEVLTILNVARRTNEPLGVTGILLYIEESFFQVLEGPAEAVLPLYAKIGRDARHARVVKLIQEPIAARAFPDWSMGYAAVTRNDLESIPGLSDFFKSKATLLDLPEGRTRKLLQAFKEGQWRARVLR
jgi:Sensors of blue-light using FAD